MGLAAYRLEQLIIIAHDPEEARRIAHEEGWHQAEPIAIPESEWDEHLFYDPNVCFDEEEIPEGEEDEYHNGYRITDTLRSYLARAKSAHYIDINE
jgi:hypothetical protein